jgi:hypothetical protein
MLDLQQFDEMRDYMSAVNALQVHMPSAPGKSRVTVGTGNAYRRTAVAIGYSRMFDNPEKPILTLGVSKSGSEKVWQAGLSFEF